MSTGIYWVLKKTHKDKQYGVEWYGFSGRSNWVDDVHRAAKFADIENALRAAGHLQKIEGRLGKHFVVRVVPSFCISEQAF